MRVPFLAALPIVLAACAGGGAATGAAPGPGGAMTADLVPFTASTATFTNARDASTRTLRVVPAPDGQSVRLVLEAPGAAPSEIRVTRRDAALWFSSDIDLGTELIRIGAEPGTKWESAGRRVGFEGWETVTFGSAGMEAARVTARRGPAGLEHVETWWFVRGVGLVRLKSDRGAISVDELVRTSP
jgi:hypothetical protein